MSSPTTPPSVAPTQPPAQRPTPVPTPPPVPVAGPAQIVAAFYSYVANDQFREAEQLWTADMRRRYLPRTNIDGRFGPTVRIDLNRNEVVSLSGAQAVVAVDLTEYRSGGEIRRYTGSWDMVLTQAGWRMNDPDLTGG